MSAPRALSQHPDDRPIRDLIATGRDASPAEVARIIERMAAYQTEILGAHASSITYHSIKRVNLERQWADGTTAEQYVADLHAATRERDARLAVDDRRVGPLAATITLTAKVLPPTRRGARPQPSPLVIYSDVRGMIVTGYQLSSFAETSIPEEARWLK